MDWYRLVEESLLELGRLVRQPPPFSLHKQQCSEIIRQFSTKLAKFWIIKTCTGGIQVHSPEFEYMKRCPQALKEVHRVLKGALSFVHACSGEFWLKTALYKADTNEALLVHIHDLLWCVVGLDVCLHRAKGNSMEICSELLARRVRDCSQELESLADRDDLLQQDVKQLLADLKKFVGEGIFRRCKRWCLPSDKSKENSRQIALHAIGTLVRQSVAMRCFGVEQTTVEIGRGGSASIFRGKWLGLWVAIKRYRLWETRDNDDIYFSNKDLRFPIGNQCHLRHPFLVRTFGMIGRAKEAGCGASIVELMSGSLSEEISRRREVTGMATEDPFHLTVAVDIMLQISRGVEYLHDLGVLHRDIKPHNILVKHSSGFLRIRISDFDLSVLKAPQTMQTDPELTWDDEDLCGTFKYLAPEYTDLSLCSWKIDVYFFAITCSVILTGLWPHEGVQLKNAKIQQIITQGHDELLLPLHCPSTITAFIKRCFDVDPAKRPHFREISSFWRHVKLVLMRVDDPKDFMSALTEFDREKFEQHRKPSPLEPSEAEGSFREPRH